MPSRRIGSVRQKLVDCDKQLQKELQRAAVGYGEEVQYALKRGVNSWSNKVEFLLDVKVDNRRIIVSVIPVGRGAQIFRWVSQGTGRYGPRKRAYQRALELKDRA